MVIYSFLLYLFLDVFGGFIFLFHQGEVAGMGMALYVVFFMEGKKEASIGCLHLRLSGQAYFQSRKLNDRTRETTIHPSMQKFIG